MLVQRLVHSLSASMTKRSLSDIHLRAVRHVGRHTRNRHCLMCWRVSIRLRAHASREHELHAQRAYKRQNDANNTGWTDYLHFLQRNSLFWLVLYARLFERNSHLSACPNFRRLFR